MDASTCCGQFPRTCSTVFVSAFFVSIARDRQLVQVHTL
jgi:hypothetical protein